MNARGYGKFIRWVVILTILVSGCVARGVPKPFPRITATSLSPAPSPRVTVTPSAPLVIAKTPTPTPTPAPTELLETAREAYRDGDWDTALVAYRRLLSQSQVTQAQREEAVLGLAQVYLADGDYDQAVALLTEFLGAMEATKPSGASPEAIADVHLLLGDALRASGAYLTATLHYSAVLDARPLLAPYAYEWMGDSFYAMGALDAAGQAYESALDGASTSGRKVALLEKLALAQAGQNDLDGALDTYHTILTIAKIPSYRARIMYQAAETALVFGDLRIAYRQMRDLIATYPADPHAYSALITLVEAGEPIDDMARGRVDYYAGAYDPAIEAFYRVIQGRPDHDGEPHYLAARSFLEAGSLELAINEFDTLIEAHPDDRYVPDAWVGKAQALLAQGHVGAAMAAYRTGIDKYPVQSQIPDAVWKLGSDLEGANALEEAVDFFSDIAEHYPNDPRAPQARFRSGLDLYRLGDIVGANAVWHELTVWYPMDEQAQAAWYWLGKVYLAAGEQMSATQALSEAVTIAPWNFYGLQAADKLAGHQPFHAYPALTNPCEQPQMQREAEVWLKRWLQLSSEEAVGTLPPSLLKDIHLQRGTLLLRLGHFDEGRAELEQLRSLTSDDPLTQYRLALYFRDIGLYRSSILAATTVWRLSPASEITDLPRFLGCLIYPTYYSALIKRAAAAQGLSPLFVYALVRQESLFEGYATSFAAAHGLMQVIPSTGAHIAQSLGWPPEYETRDLYRPMVSVRFGVWYLAQQRDLFSGNLFAALAAYNGGPGNASKWWEAANGDEDLFVELIGFQETRQYVRRIREHYAVYQWLYSNPKMPPMMISITRGWE